MLHPDDEVIAAYAAGTLPEVFAIVVAAHIASCPACHALVRTHECIAGAMLAELPPEDMHPDALAKVLARINGTPDTDPPMLNPGLPVPLDRVPMSRWWPVLPGVWVRLIHSRGCGRGFVVSVAPGARLPRHRALGRHYTAMLSGSHLGLTGFARAGDFVTLLPGHEDGPHAVGDKPCIAVVATDGVRLCGLLGEVQRMIGF